MSSKSIMYWVSYFGERSNPCPCSLDICALYYQPGTVSTRINRWRAFREVRLMWRTPVTKKCEVVEEQIRIGKMRETARNYKVYPSQIRRCRANYSEIKSVPEQSP